MDRNTQLTGDTPLLVKWTKPNQKKKRKVIKLELNDIINKEALMVLYEIYITIKENIPSSETHMKQSPKHIHIISQYFSLSRNDTDQLCWLKCAKSGNYKLIQKNKFSAWKFEISLKQLSGKRQNTNWNCRISLKIMTNTAYQHLWGSFKTEKKITASNTSISKKYIQWK